MLKINDCISYIQKIEEAYPDWTALTILDNLRFDSYNSSFFQKMLGTDSSRRVEPKGNLTLQQRDDLYDSIQHGADINDKSKESGISLDPSTNRMVAFGHVIVGIAAGVRHPLPAYKVTIPGFGIFKDRVTYITKVFSLRKMIREPIGIDSLYALTITGDIGQTATSKHTLCRDSCMWGGVGSDASSAELHGDIDGFLIGYWLCSTKEGQIFRKKMYDEKNTYNLSTLLGVYYRTKQNTYLSSVMRSPMSNQPLEAIRRFTNMSAELKDPKHRTIFIGQSMAFNNWYSSVLLRIFPDSSKTLIALADFKKWCDGNGVVKNFGAANDNVTNLLRGTEAFMVSQNLATFIDEPIATSLDEEPEELIASWDTNSDVFNA